MDETGPSVAEYRVVYSERVRNGLKDLVAHASKQGMKKSMLQEITELDYRLRIFPQFGEPLIDLDLKPARLMIGVVGSLVVRYFLDEEKRLVMVVAPITQLQGS